jgi:hypothetical protein
MLPRYPIACAIILLLIISPVLSAAQAEADLTVPSQSAFDTAYIADHTDVLTSRLFLVFQNASLLINPDDEKISKIIYRPNVNVGIGIAGFYKWLGLGLSIDNPFFKTDRNEYGKTNTLDLRVNAFGRDFAAELFYQHYNGFYISSPERPDKTHYIIPDMKSYSLGISGYWIYNSKKFSIRAAFIQNERQKKSAGSFVLRPAFLYYQISSNNGIIPADLIDLYRIPPSTLVTSGKFYTLGLSPGYAYTLVFLKYFYLTAAVFPGITAHYSTFTHEINNYSDFKLTFQLDGRFALGYNSDKWFLGGSFQTGFNQVPHTLSNALFSYNVTQFLFWGGTRFDVFKKKHKHTGSVNN